MPGSCSAAASASLLLALLAAPARAQPLPPSPSPGPAAFSITSSWAVGGCVGPANSIVAKAVGIIGSCPTDPAGYGCFATNAANTTSVFYGACMSGVPAPAIAVAAVPPAVAAVPGTMVFSSFSGPGCAAGVNTVTGFNVTQLGVCVNQTKAIYTCIGSSALAMYYNTSDCSGVSVASQLWSSGCVAQPPALGTGSYFISGCQTARGPGQTYNPALNAASAQAALIVPLVLGSLVLCFTGVVYFRRQAAGGDGVKLVDASGGGDARAGMQQQQVPPPLPPKAGRASGGGRV